jgi:hypothetical protein
MKTIQMRKAGAARGHYWGLQSAKAEGLSDRNTFFIYATDERGSGLEENVRLCSPMFAYVRLCSLNSRKTLAAAGRGHCGLQNARNDELAKPVRNGRRPNQPGLIKGY